MSATEGRVFNIQKFSIHDGPGIRTVVFLKGCPLACTWCSNPNSRKLRPLMIRDANDPNVFVEDSREYQASDVVRICLQDQPFYEESGGGVTLSGGEPLVQHRFAVTLLKLLQQEGIHTAIETTGYVTNAIFTKALAHCDLVIMDVKHHDKDRHKRWTGVRNDLPLSNLRLAIEAGVPVWARIPVIPGVNDAVEEAPAFAAHLLRHGITRVQLLPFHQYGERKYELLGWEYDFAGATTLHEEDVEPFRQALIAEGVNASFDPPEAATTAVRRSAAGSLTHTADDSTRPRCESVSSVWPGEAEDARSGEGRG